MFYCIYVRSVVSLWSQSLRPQWTITPVFDSWRYCSPYSADQTRISAFQTYHQIFIFYCKWWSSNLEKLYPFRWLFTAYTSLEIRSLSQSLRPCLIFVNHNQVEVKKYQEQTRSKTIITIYECFCPDFFLIPASEKGTVTSKKCTNRRNR